MKRYLVSFNWSGPYDNGFGDGRFTMSEKPTFEQCVQWRDEVISALANAGANATTVVMLNRMELSE